MRGEATTPDEGPATAADRPGAARAALDRVGRRWALALWSFAGVGTPDGPWLMPILYVAPPLLAVALWRLAPLTPRRPRRLLRSATLLVGPGWALGLWGSLDGGPFSLGQRLAQGCGTVGFALCCTALWRWRRTVDPAAAAARWARAARQSGLAVGLLAAIAVADATGEGSLLAVGRPGEVSSLVIGLVVALVVVVVGALISAKLAMEATRASPVG